MIRDGIVNACIGMSASLITLLLVFEYLERPRLRNAIRRILWGIQTQFRCQETVGEHRHGTIIEDMVGGYVIVAWDDEPPTLIHIGDIEPERTQQRMRPM